MATNSSGTAPHTAIVPGQGASAVTYTLPAGLYQYIESVVATVDTSGSGDVTAVLTVADDSSTVIADKEQARAITAGGSGRATWALRLTDETSAATGGGGLEYNVGTYGPLNVGDSVDVEVTNPAPNSVLGGSFYLHGTSGDMIPLEIRAASNAQAIGEALDAVSTDRSSQAIGIWLDNVSEGDGTTADAGQALGLWIQSLLGGGNANGVLLQAIRATGAGGQAIAVIAPAVRGDFGFGFVANVTGDNAGPGTVATGANVNAVATGAGDAVGVETRAVSVGGGVAWAILVDAGLVNLKLPGGDPGVSGALWNNGGVVNVSP